MLATLLEFDGIKHVLHTIPSEFFTRLRSHCRNGVVIAPLS